MRVMQLNATCGVGSTGKICLSISRLLNEKGIENKILYSTPYFEYENGICLSNRKKIKFQALKSRVLGNLGLNSKSSTKRIIEEIEKFKPDIFHIHNIHGHDCNIEALFKYLNKTKIKVVWTFHDCWAFTAYCPHFDFEGCDRWKTGCYNCPQRKNFSFLFDKSKMLYQKKKELFSSLDLTIATPSKWLKGLVEESFLGDKEVRVINNGINLSLFSPTESDLKRRLGIPEEKKIILGVAFFWTETKGLDMFLRLEKDLDFDKYQIVLIGKSSFLSQNPPEKIIHITKTNGQEELAEYYSAASLLVNPTKEDTFPTVNIEALACGTPVLTFKTGGSPEILNEKCGVAVEKNDYNALLEEIEKISKKPFLREDILKRAEDFNENDRFSDYVNLYNELI